MDIPQIETCPITIDLSYVIPCYFDQQDCESLNELLSKYSCYEPTLLDRIQFVIVDDCSPTPITISSGIDLHILLLRIKDDILWNQGGARNLGVLYSRCDKVLATDLDHEFSEDTLRHIVSLPPPGRKMYMMHRRSKEGQVKHPHPNTFVMSRGRFLQLFGVDEEFCGSYGSEDGMFWRWQRYNGTRFSYLNKKYPSIERTIDKDRSYHSLVRDRTRNQALKKRKKREWARWGPRGGHSRQFLKFTWEVLEDRKRSHVTWTPRENRMWKKLWWLRQIF